MRFFIHGLMIGIPSKILFPFLGLFLLYIIKKMFTVSSFFLYYR